MSFIKRRETIDEFIKNELGEYLSTDEYKIKRSEQASEETIEDGMTYEYYTLEAEFNNKKREVELRIDEEENIEVDLCEGNRNKTVSYDRQAKYFWMAFLD